jgi:hypothetical protein
MAGVVEPVSVQFPVPWGRFTSLEALPGNPFDSSTIHLVDRVRGPVNCDAFGMAWSLHFLPAGIGRTVRTVTYFDRTVAELMEVKVDIGLTTYNGPIHLVRQDEDRFFFSEFPIERMSIWVYPGVTIDLFWILAL